jgi:hypothetical protein
MTFGYAYIKESFRVQPGEIVKPGACLHCGCHCAYPFVFPCELYHRFTEHGRERAGGCFA